MHGDVKPENIFLTEYPNGATCLKLGDFGSAHYFVPGRVLEGICGTPAYMAPEVFSGRYNERADVWSLGVTLYSLLTRRHLFYDHDPPAANALGVNDLYRVDNPSADDHLSRDVHLQIEDAPISPAAKHLLRGMLQRDPRERLSIAKVLAHPWLKVASDIS